MNIRYFIYLSLSNLFPIFPGILEVANRFLFFWNISLQYFLLLHFLYTGKIKMTH
jgi:hypothetical protein